MVVSTPVSTAQDMLIAVRERAVNHLAVRVVDIAIGITDTDDEEAAWLVEAMRTVVGDWSVDNIIRWHQLCDAAAGLGWSSMGPGWWGDGLVTEGRQPLGVAPEEDDQVARWEKLLERYPDARYYTSLTWFQGYLRPADELVRARDLRQLIDKLLEREDGA